MNKFLNCESTSKCYQQRKGSKEGTLSEYCVRTYTDVHRCHDWKTVYIFLQQQRSAGQDVCGGWADTATLDTGPPHSSVLTRAT